MRRCRPETYTEDEFRLTYIMAQIPLQVRPSPEYPGLHLQLKDPLVLLQTALALHLFFSVAHSSIYGRTSNQCLSTLNAGST